MKFVLCVLCMLALFLKSDQLESPFTRHKGINGGIACAGCTFAVGLVEQLAQVHNKTITDTVNDLCKLLPEGVYYDACTAIIHRYGPVVIDLLYANVTPDIVCHAIRFCHVDPHKHFCNLFPLPKHSPDGDHLKKMMKHAQLIGEKYFGKEGIHHFPDICYIPGIRFICKLVNSFVHQHKPVLDLDKDSYSTVETMRGASWRGRDCNDADSAVYPGTRPKHSDIEVDSNCNGIYGVDKDGVPYEDKFCQKSSHLGVGILGDSAAAHFHIPEEWLMASVINKDLLKHLPFVVENEFDWPMMSSATGYVNITWPIIQGPVHSIYTIMKNQNRCVHRDYQNLAVNGAKSTGIQDYQKQLSRNQTDDYPLLLFYALVGNDVCNGYPDTVAHMTTAKQMKQNVLKTLKYLDTRLPKGSHIILIGLADGRVLYNSMYWRYHPIGQFNKDIKYPDFYEYLRCLEISPCNGWMTSNSTLRELTYKHVVQLNNILRSIAVSYREKFNNFDVIYVDCPLMPVLEQWEKIHGKNTGYQLIEPVDGFHPNQYAMVLTAQYTWDLISLKAPHMLGDVNPHNTEIDNIFGDQGGY